MGSAEFTRDIIFYMISLAQILFFGLYGQITFLMNLGYIFTYLIYIFVVIYVGLMVSDFSNQT